MMQTYKKDSIDLSEELKIANRRIADLEAEIEALSETEEELRNRLFEAETEMIKCRNSFWEIEDAFFWKISKPLRTILDTAKRFRRNKVTTGIGTAKITNKELSKQRRHRFGKDIRFSIAVPLYNTPESFLRDMIESVLAQTYSGWELCLADGSDDSHSYVEGVCREYCERDGRIRYKRLERNLGISENTNACLDMASGEYIALVDHDDILHPAALYEMMRVICEKEPDLIYTDEASFIGSDIQNISNIHFKPDFAPDNLMAINYICHLTTFKRTLLEKTGKFRSEYDGSQDHDMMLRLTEAAERIEHIPEVLYYWRAHPNSVAYGIRAKDYASEAGRNAVLDSLRRRGIDASVEGTKAHSCIYRVRYAVKGTPLVSIVIPSCDHVDELKTCINSILGKTTYSNYEIVIAENNSREAATFDYYRELAAKNENIRVIIWAGEFNYSAINNYAVREAVKGEYVLLLNNDTEVITPEWIEEMLMYAQRKDVGAVGTMLYYPNGTIQHAGVILGMGGIAGHAYQREKPDDFGYMSRLAYAQDMTAVTAACMMIRRDVWDEVGGLDEEFAVAFNDTDLCMRIRKAGYLIIWTPYAELYHYESLSRGMEDTPEKQARFESEKELFRSRWRAELDSGDPYYNPNLTLNRADFTPNNTI